MPTIAATYVDLAIVFLKTGEIGAGIGAVTRAGLNAATMDAAPDRDAAISGLREALALFAQNPEAHNVLGLLLGRKGAEDTKEVLTRPRRSREAAQLRPDFAEAQENKQRSVTGLVLLTCKNRYMMMRQGLPHFVSRMRIRPDYADAHRISARP